VPFTLLGSCAVHGTSSRVQQTLGSAVRCGAVRTLRYSDTSRQLQFLLHEMQKIKPPFGDLLQVKRCYVLLPKMLCANEDVPSTLLVTLLQLRAVRCGAVQCGAVQCSAVQRTQW
jgi:hypothetical protein